MPVPSSTTSVMKSRQGAGGLDGVIAWPSTSRLGALDERRRPARAPPSPASARIELAAVGDGRRDQAICSGVASRRSWPIAVRSTSIPAAPAGSSRPGRGTGRRRRSGRWGSSMGIGRRSRSAPSVRRAPRSARSGRACRPISANVAVDRVHERRSGSRAAPGVSPRKLQSCWPWSRCRPGRRRRVSGRRRCRCVERHGGRHDLERRARRVEALRGAVEHARPSASRPPPGLPPVTARLGSYVGHDAITSTSPVRGLERDDGAAQPALAQRGHGLALRRACRGCSDHVVAASTCAASSSSRSSRPPARSAVAPVR